MPAKTQQTTKTDKAKTAKAAAVAETPASKGEEAAGSEARDWGNPYKPIFSSKDKGFEMGENRRFKQRVFIFTEKQDEQILAALKDNGFTYRAGEKAWTIQADAETRKLSDELAREFAGQAASMSR
jgi:hypothetical protein